MRRHVAPARESASILPEELHSGIIVRRADYLIISRLPQYLLASFPIALFSFDYRKEYPPRYAIGAGI
jgi:hypothetical protein